MGAAHLITQEDHHGAIEDATLIPGPSGSGALSG